MSGTAVTPAPDLLTPGRDCPLCPRLAAFRQRQRQDHPDWHNAPVPAFGPLDAPVLVLGLAPGLKGANRTGRPFTGDYAGELLYRTLTRFGLADGDYRADPGDGLRLLHVRISNAARCVPPENKPTPAEVATCRRFLVAEIACMPRLKAVLALGSVAHASALAACGARPSAFPFRHGAVHELPNGLVLADSYHCSRYNTNTGRLTAAMFEAVFAALALRLPGIIPSRG